jgi:hypothetical protein
MTEKSRPRASAPAPPREERNDDGVLRVATASLKIPVGIDAESPESKARVDAVVYVIVGVAVAFVLFVAWLIHTSQ